MDSFQKETGDLVSEDMEKAEELSGSFASVLTSCSAPATVPELHNQWKVSLPTAGGLEPHDLCENYTIYTELHDNMELLSLQENKENHKTKLKNK